MQADSFEARLRAGEYMHAVRLVPGTWTVVRVDGRSFSRWTETNCEKPFDPAFHRWMVEATRTLFEEFQGVYAYSQSDESSILLPPRWALFDREWEKVVSLSAGIMSSAFSLASGKAAHFDSRVWVGAGIQDVVDYFRWRQSDAARCALFGWAYWTLRKEGLSERDAGARLESTTEGDRNELLFQRGINYNHLPLWQRRGVGFVWETYQKEGLNPRTGEKVTAQRRRAAVVEELAMKDEYAAFVRQLASAVPEGS